MGQSSHFGDNRLFRQLMENFGTITMNNLYCKIYINTALPRTLLVNFIAKTCHGTVTLRTISSTLFQIDVITNEEADPRLATSSEDGFLYYPYYLEIDPQNSAVESNLYVTAIAGLLRSFWEQGATAVASCDFEEELPRFVSKDQQTVTVVSTLPNRPAGIQLSLPVSGVSQSLAS